MTTQPAVPTAGRHGGDGPRLAQALGLDPATILDLSQSMNPFAPSVGAMVARHLDSLGRYPDPHAGAALLADAIGVDRDRLRLTNGGSEAITLVTAEIGGRVHAEPEFALHPRGDATGPVWRSDPHNPSGRLATDTESADVWDEAFYSLAAGKWTAHRPGVTVGSLTKVFACPGLRLGYVIADDVERFTQRQPHWSVSSLALAALPDMLEGCDLPSWQRAIARQRTALAGVFTSRGFGVDPADAPWVLVDAPGLRERLAPTGVIVRDCSSFGMPGTARVAVADDEGLARLSAALDRTAS